MIILEDPFSFQWDKDNLIKILESHNVTYFECEEAFNDPNKVMLKDVKHSLNEERYLMIGKTNLSRYLFVVFTMRKDKIRVISARDLNKKEYKLYEKKD